MKHIITTFAILCAACLCMGGVSGYVSMADGQAVRDAASLAALKLARSLACDRAAVLRMKEQGPVRVSGLYFVVTSRSVRLDKRRTEQVIVTAYRSLTDALNHDGQAALQEINLLGKYDL
jgi:hypothetical protein